MIVLRRRHLQLQTSAGLLMALVSAASFGTSGTLATSLLRAGWTPLAAVTVRIAVAALVLTPPALLAARRAPGWWRGAVGPIGLYGLLAVAGTQLCYFEAVHHLSVAVALLLEYSGTVVVVGWQWLRHRVRPGAATAGGGVLAFAGLALVLGLIGGVHVDAAGVAWGLGAALGNAAYFLIAAAPPADGAPGVPALVAAWAGMATGAVVVGAAALAGVLPWAAPPVRVDLAGHHVSWLVPVLGLSLVAAAFAYVAGIAAAQRLGARVASFVGLTEVCFASLYALVALGQGMTGLQVVGGVLVLAGIAVVRNEPDAPRPAAASDEADALAGLEVDLALD